MGVAQRAEEGWTTEPVEPCRYIWLPSPITAGGGRWVPRRKDHGDAAPTIVLFPGFVTHRSPEASMASSKS
jgi:hypothetical protein